MSMFLAANDTLASIYLWPLVALAAPAILTLTLFLIGRWSSRDKDARDVHRAVTSGVGAEARAALSNAEFDWWNDGRSPAPKAFDRDAPARRGFFGHHQREGCWRRGQRGEKIDPELFKQFYILDASLAQLVAILSQYSKRDYWLGQSQRYRRLLGWHTGIHIAWVVWFVSVTCETKPDRKAGDPDYVPVERLTGAWQRAEDALMLVGDHKIVCRTEPDRTVRDYVADELRQWVGNATKGDSRPCDTEIRAVKALAEKLVPGSFSNPEEPGSVD